MSRLLFMMAAGEARDSAATRGTLLSARVPPESRPGARPSVRGKFLFLGSEKLYVRGVTYGTFRPDEVGNDHADSNSVERDFAEMSAAGLNAIRTYTVPPRWLLDAAARHGLFVMVGLPWEQHVAFLDDRRGTRSIEESVSAGVRACAGHPAVLCYVIGNEIPTAVVRWHGPRRIERYLERLCRAAREVDPGGLVTYVNYPSTEYLDLSFADIVCFNVYLESRSRLEAYLARLQNLADDRPLLLAEIGLDSRRNGEDVQANVLSGQVRSCFAAGCAGAFVFAWTDEWYRGGHDIEDWDFGLTDRDRRAKPALAAVRDAFADAPFADGGSWPRISVAVCTHNGERTLRDCLEGLAELDYPDYEVIVVDDGSEDASAALVHENGFRVISTENRGLAAARNTALDAATGEIVAYLDDDARPDPQWLRYLARSFAGTKHVGVGGPNVPPADDGPIAECVANAPGGPLHVLLSDEIAEHIPGCNMAFRKEVLQAIGGFDPQFRATGDDVDVCWRLQQRGWTIGFSPAAMVWHHRHNSLRAYWKQQRGYGRAEALLERKWPEKYNHAGHVSWAGRPDGRGLVPDPGPRRWRVYYGTWGSALFQSVDRPAPRTLGAFPAMPEWNLVVALLAGLSALGALWQPLLLALPLLVLAVGFPLAHALVGASRASFPGPPRSPIGRLGLHGLTASLYLAQPAARLAGRLGFALTPWRLRGRRGLTLPRRRTMVEWSETWRPAGERLSGIEAALRKAGVVVQRGGGYDRWDLHVRGGIGGAGRLRLGLEEHGAGKQLVRYRVWPVFSLAVFPVVAALTGLAVSAWLSGGSAAAVVLEIGAFLVLVKALLDAAAAAAALVHAVEREGEAPDADAVAALTARVRAARRESDGR